MLFLENFRENFTHSNILAEENFQYSLSFYFYKYNKNLKDLKFCYLLTKMRKFRMLKIITWYNYVFIVRSSICDKAKSNPYA